MVAELAGLAERVRARLVEPYEIHAQKNHRRPEACPYQRLMSPMLPDLEGQQVNSCWKMCSASGRKTAVRI